VNVLSAQPWWVLLPGSLLFVATATVLFRSLVLHLLESHRTTHASAFAAPLMPALGVLFAFLSGFAITAMWASHSAAETSVGQEAAAASALAWAATAPGANTAAIQRALHEYLMSTTTQEWLSISAAEPTGDLVTDDLTTLQRTARASASNPNVTSADAAELLGSLDQVAAHRSERISAAGRSMPLALFLAILVTGLALCLNAQIVSSAGDRRSRMVTSSIVVVVSIDLAVLLILSGPFLGSQRVSAAPLRAIQVQLESGVISP